jgi:replicative DNA helicase
MSLGLALIKKVIKKQTDLAKLSINGITEDHFHGEDEKRAYQSLFQHYKLYGQLPSLAVVRADAEVSFPKNLPKEPLSFWMDQVKQRHIEFLYKEALKTLSKCLRDSDIKEAESVIKSLFFATRQNSEIGDLKQLSDLREELIEHHDRKQRSPGILGISFGLPFLDEMSDGAQPGDLVIILGRLGKGKTYLLARMSLAAMNQKKSVLFVSPEMQNVQMARRLFSLHANLPSKALKQGTLSFFGKDHLRKAKLPETDFWLLRPAYKFTVENLYLLAQQLQPDCIDVDSAYFLHTSSKVNGRFDRLSYTAEMLKELATALGIPVRAAYQLNREAAKSKGGAEMHHIYMSDVIGQLASIAIGIGDIKNEKDDGMLMQELNVMKGRDGESGKVKVVIDPLRMTMTEMRNQEGEDEKQE